MIIEIRPSIMLPGQIGLFAARALKKDVVIAEVELFGERFMPWSAIDAMDEITKNKVRQYCLQTEDGFYAPSDFNWLAAPWNMNHSCDYNVGFDDHGNFVTVRSVDKGEELTWDYGMDISDPKFRLQCACGSYNCRGLITGNDWKKAEFVQKNRKYFERK